MLRDATLFIVGSALLPEVLYCCFDTSFAGEHRRRPHALRVLIRVDAKTDRAMTRRHMHSIDVSGRRFSTRGDNPYDLILQPGTDLSDKPERPSLPYRCQSGSIVRMRESGRIHEQYAIKPHSSGFLKTAQ